eukprot:CAMPEP_0170613776 /NCGR_PEP_ID=MMETSP0224-20130122/24452_1 /TAXON_ID=285029 /ORGANISM="Togula jolla, Strain CCCM 725" /LENGTH=135 /DNA_ID=CAMNT_0010939399 /DNA_START=26 /DNA_END=433 /DNA_ORIENTATION=-
MPASLPARNRASGLFTGLLLGLVLAIGVFLHGTVRSMAFAKPGIIVEKMSKEEAEAKYKISSWGTWGCDVSKFDWTYSGTEAAYILEGEVTVTPTGEWKEVKPVTIGEGDYAVFPDGMTCVWDVHKAIKKHFNFS